MSKIAYIEELDMTQFTRLDSVSVYNYNYYNGFGIDLLFASSDDDNTTEWFLVKNEKFHYLGNSYVNTGNKLELIDESFR